MTDAPPRSPLFRFLRWCVAPADRDDVVADLVADYAAGRARGQSVLASRLALYDQLLRSAIASRRLRRIDAAERGSAPMLAGMRHDVKTAWRQHRRRAVSSVSAVVTIALAVGLNTALVSVAHGVLFAPLPIDDPGRVVFVWDLRSSGDHGALSPGRAIDVRTRVAAFADAAFLGHVSMTVIGAGPVDRWSGASVSASFFDVLGAKPAIGRTFHRDVTDRDVVVLSHRLWQEQLGGDAGLIGRSFVMNGRTRVVAGVMPADFYWPMITALPSAGPGPDFWTCAPASDVPEGPFSQAGDIALNRVAGYLRLVARLKADATSSLAAAQLTALAGDLGREHAPTDGGHSLSLVPLETQFFGRVRTSLLFLALASLLVVLLACANVANLLLMRLPSRAREMAIRVSLGAGRARLARQLLIEGLMLAVAGGVAGLVLGRLSLGAILAYAPSGVGRLDRVTFSLPVLMLSVGAILICGLVCGVLPAIAIRRANPAAELRAAGAAVPTRPVLRQALVAVQVALAVTLVVGATAFATSLWRLQHVDVGFDAQQLLTFEIALTGDRAASQAKQVAFYEDLLGAIRRLPGVRSAGGASTLPIGGDDWWAPLVLDGRTLPAPGSEPRVGYQLITAGWFDTLGVRLLEGRDFSQADRHPDAPVAIVNATLAARAWPGESAVGKRVRNTRREDLPWLTVVGVVQDIHHLGPAAPVRPEIFEPYSQSSVPLLAVAIRATDALPAAAIRSAVATLDPAVPIARVQTMAYYLNGASDDGRFLAALTLTFGGLALVLAVVGVYGVVGQSTAQRTREFGLRAALGARGAGIAAMVLRQGMMPVCAGAIAGTVTAIALGGVARRLLFETTPADPMVCLIAATATCVSAALACWIPARRAARIDPLAAIRSDG